MFFNTACKTGVLVCVCRFGIFGYRTYNMELIEKHFGSYFLSSDKARIDPVTVHRFLSEGSYWAQHIPYETVVRSIAHSFCLGAYTKEQEQVGFARLITDQATFAYMADVFVLPDHRGTGISKVMMDIFCTLADEWKLRRFLLTTMDAHGLYSQFGFEPFPFPERMMSRKGFTYS